MILISVILGLLVFAGILGGYILGDYAAFHETSWHYFLLGRIGLHAIGIFSFSGIYILLTDHKWSALLFSILIVILMNINPIRDLYNGPVSLVHPKIEKILKEEYNNPSSDFDYSTKEVVMIKLSTTGREEKSLIISEEDWEKTRTQCANEVPVSVTGLRQMEMVVSWTCPN